MAYIVFKEKKNYYRTFGHGRPVILLHGFGEDGQIWNQQLEKLSQNNFLIIPDLPDCGQSEMMEEAKSLEDFAEVVKAIANEEILPHHPNFALIGHSMGGYISLAFAKKYPQYLNSLRLFHSSAFADSVAKIETRKKNIEFIQSHGTIPFLRTAVPNLFSKETQELHPELIENLISIGSKISAETLIQFTKAMMERPDNTGVLKSLLKPILFIIGVHDTSVPLEISLQQCHIPKNSTVHFLQHSGHVGMWEESNVATQYLENFLLEI